MEVPQELLLIVEGGWSALGRQRCLWCDGLALLYLHSSLQFQRWIWWWSQWAEVGTWLLSPVHIEKRVHEHSCATTHSGEATNVANAWGCLPERRQNHRESGVSEDWTNSGVEKGDGNCGLSTHEDSELLGPGIFEPLSQLHSNREVLCKAKCYACNTFSSGWH